MDRTEEVMPGSSSGFFFRPFPDRFVQLLQFFFRFRQPAFFQRPLPFAGKSFYLFQRPLPFAGKSFTSSKGPFRLPAKGLPLPKAPSVSGNRLTFAGKRFKSNKGGIPEQRRHTRTEAACLVEFCAFKKPWSLCACGGGSASLSKGGLVE